MSSTDISTEVQGLDQSIAYARNLATFAGEHGQAGNEGYLAVLTGAKVEGQALKTAADMQEAFDTAQAAAEAHAAELERQKGVQEAYDANPDAGDKDFQLTAADAGGEATHRDPPEPVNISASTVEHTVVHHQRHITVTDPDLRTALVHDDQMEEYGMHPDDRRTCNPCQTWATSEHLDSPPHVALMEELGVPGW